MGKHIHQLEWRRDQLWKGCLLVSIGHAIANIQYPEFSYEHSWDGVSYSANNGQGARGTITFHPKCCVGAIRDEHSERVKRRKRRDATEYLDGAPPIVVELAQETTLRYLLDRFDGTMAPLVTAAFWGIDEELYSGEPFEQMMAHGGHLLQVQAGPIETAVEYWREEFDLTQPQLDLMLSIYERKVADPSGVLVLTRREIDTLGEGDEEGLRESRISFKEIGVEWEV